MINTIRWTRNHKFFVSAPTNNVSTLIIKLMRAQFSFHARQHFLNGGCMMLIWFIYYCGTKDIIRRRTDFEYIHVVKHAFILLRINIIYINRKRAAYYISLYIHYFHNIPYRILVAFYYVRWNWQEIPKWIIIF